MRRFFCTAEQLNLLHSRRFSELLSAFHDTYCIKVAYKRPLPRQL